MPILEIFDEIPDPRRFNARHGLTDILFVALLAMLCGAKHCTEMAEFAKARLEFLRQFVPLEHGAPSHDTFSGVFRALDPAAFGAAFQKLMAAFGQQARYEAQGQLAVDGKSLRRAYDKGLAHMPPLVVTVFECRTFMSLAQQVASAGGEVEAAIQALEMLDLAGCTVSGDALNCHRRFTRTVVERGGDYLLTIKANQFKLAKQAAAALDKAAARPGAAVVQSEDKAHGRHELRQAFVTAFRQSPGKNALVGLKAVGRVEVQRTVDGATSHQARDFALSWRSTPAELLGLSRAHWAIENNLHWQLDVLMGEDQARSRKNNAPANLAQLRRLTLNVLQADPTKIPLSHKRLRARWNEQELLRLMTHMR
ncbi:MAG: ISAs1 family transposase [Gemmatimonadales bacterium]